MQMSPSSFLKPTNQSGVYIIALITMLTLALFLFLPNHLSCQGVGMFGKKMVENDTMILIPSFDHHFKLTSKEVIISPNNLLSDGQEIEGKQD